MRTDTDWQSERWTLWYIFWVSTVLILLHIGDAGLDDKLTTIAASVLMCWSFWMLTWGPAKKK